ncbi:MAG: hypothetical protein JXR83_22295, partial [Deltaproteobacteria bacterium]|nr:hypothetical protein [Deltaproteobacteria bacterium]
MSRSNGAFLIACTLLASSGCGLFAAAAPPRCDGDSDCPSGYTCASGNCLARGPGDAAASERPSADAGGALDRRGGDAPWDSGPRDAEGGCPLCPTCWGNTANFDFDDTALDFSTEVDLSGCSPTIDTSLEPGSMISDWCGPRPAPVVQTQAGGPSIVVVPMASLVVGAGSTVRLVGDKPVVIAVRGDALINGLIDASAQGTTPGAGGDLSTDGEIATAGGPIGSGDCAVFASGTGQGMDGTAYASLGGGGAGFRTNG